MPRRFARENFTSGRRRRPISSSMLKPPIVAERLAERHTPHSWTSFRGFQSFHFRYGSNTCLRGIEVWHRAYPICDAPGFRVWRGPPSLSFRNRGVITVLTCEQNCPIRYGFLASTPLPRGAVWRTSCLTCAGTNHPLYCMLVQCRWLVRPALTNLCWTFIISKKYRVLTSTRFSHFFFSYLFIMNLKYFVTSRHHSGALISSMRQILNYLLG